MTTVSNFLQLFDAYLRENTFHQAPTALYEPANYLMELGGKRLRPLLAMLGYYQFRDDVEQSLPAAMAVELFHNFSLMHDDIMDAAPTRRGKATVHTVYGLNAAILSGDVMLVYAYDFLMRTRRSEALPDMVRTLNRVAIQVCEGQQYDVDFETASQVGIADYLHMIELKTAALLAGSLELGAMAAGAPQEDQYHLREFGRLTGLAFQLQDDYLDVFGNPETFGKRPGGDIVQNKKTFLYLKALEQADPDQHQELTRWYQTNDEGDAAEKIATVTRLMEQLNIPEHTRQIRDDHQREALLHIEQLAAREERKELLVNFAYSLLDRTV
jgi:geranylgeranyl diphosphate synthase type II